MGNLANFATSLVATAPSPATSGPSLVVTAGEGVRFPAVPFYATVHPKNFVPTLDNAEAVLVTARTTDTFTITRAQKGTTAKSIDTTFRISNTIFVEDLFNGSQIQNEVPGGSVNGSNVTFTTASSPQTGTLRVFKNGIRLKNGGADFTETSTGFTMVTAPVTGTVLLADYRVGGTSDYSVGTNSTISDETVTGSVNSSNTSFTTLRPYIANNLEVFINGLKQIRGVDYMETTPTTGSFTLTVAPTTGDIIRVNYQYNLNSSSNADTVDGYHADDLSPVGAGMDYWGIALPSANWAFANGQSLLRTDYPVLFSRLGTTYGAVDGTHFNLPDKRGRGTAGKDDMGGTSANRLTNPGSTVGGLDGDVLGGTGGAETHVITIAQLAAHTHNITNFVSNGGAYAGGAFTSKDTVSSKLTDATGGDAAHNNVQPTIIANYIIKVL